MELSQSTTTLTSATSKNGRKNTTTLRIRSTLSVCCLIMLGGLLSWVTPVKALGSVDIPKPKVSPTTHHTNAVHLSCRAVAAFALLQSNMKKSSNKQEGHAFAIRMLDQDPAFLRLVGRDRAFSRLLLSTSERRAGQIGKVIQSFVRKPTAETNQSSSKKTRPSDALCDAALRIGASQLLFLETPTYAAVSETVEILRMHPKIKVSKSQISFVNAVLRKMSQEGKEKLKETSVLDNIDPWIANQWIETYGKNTTETMVQAAMSQSPIFLTVNHWQSPDKLKLVRDAFSSEVDSNSSSSKESVAEILPIGSIRVPATLRGSVSNWPLYEDGVWWVQDPSATLPAIALFKSLQRIKEGGAESMHVVDLCSAPGGKCAQLCSMGFGRIDAIEISKTRSRSLRQNLRRLGMETSCNVTVQDGRTWIPNNADDASNTVDGILVDAPCSATGLGSRRPDVLRKKIDLEELVTVQRELLAHAVDNVLKPGGVVVFATCSLLKQEGEHQVEWLLSRQRGGTGSNSVAKVETEPFLPGEIAGFDDCIDKNGWLRVLPGTLPGALKHCDGFFVARLKRIE